MSNLLVGVGMASCQQWNLLHRDFVSVQRSQSGLEMEFQRSLATNLPATVTDHPNNQDSEDNHLGGDEIVSDFPATVTAEGRDEIVSDLATNLPTTVTDHPNNQVTDLGENSEPNPRKRNNIDRNEREHIQRKKRPSTSTNPEDLPGLRNSGRSAIPETADEELSFLEVDDNTPLRSPVTQDSDGLSERERALAQHLKERCSSSPTSSHTSGDLSLNKILEGKTRKIAARMFYDTLVLKSRGLIDMKQDQPYSDITLKLMPALSSKAQL